MPHGPSSTNSSSQYISTTCGFLWLWSHLALLELFVCLLAVSLDTIQLEVHVLFIYEWVAHDVAPKVIVVSAVGCVPYEHFSLLDHDFFGSHIDLAQHLEEVVVVGHGSHVFRHVVVANVEGVGWIHKYPLAV